MYELKSKRLRFINSTVEILEKILEGRETLAEHLQLTVPEGWSEFETGPFKFVLEKIKAYPDDAPWWNWLAILINEEILIGNCGYVGPPKDGVVEIGYGVISSYRGIGLATEIASVLIDNAFAFTDVSCIIAHTLPKENASCKVLRKNGFRYAGKDTDPDEGVVWRWELQREA